MTAADERAFLQALGACVRTLRLDQGRTQNELADSAGVSVLSLRGLEYGVHAVNVLMLRRLATALQVPLALVMDEADDPSLALVVSTVAPGATGG